MIPYAFLLPGLGLIALMLLYPAVQTINYSFANEDSTAYVGFDNYVSIFKDARLPGVDLQQHPVADHRARPSWWRSA